MRVSPIVDFIVSELYSEYRHRNNLEDEFEPRRPGPVEYGKYNCSYENSIAICAVPNGGPSSQDESIKSPAVPSDAILHVVVEQVPIRDEKFITELRQLDNEYTGVRKPDKIRQVFMLQIYHAHLKAYAAFLEEFEASYTSPRKRLFFNPQYSQLRSWTMKAIISDSIIYNQLASSAKDITATCESLLEILNSNERRARRPAILDRRRHPRLLPRDLQHQLDLLNLSWNVNQSQNVKVLTLLATVFLPLSLSAGILSMNTRFKDLGDLMYDFIGVVVLLGALALKKLGALIFITLGGLVLVSFVIGMFKELL
ncbi:hypothetical protein LY76DRAFT_601903 [Colletotrichum caudatum]|nr:hypothetical protein LY76DRAFT_601903 [Colletotrichum caudatum]